ncbi:MAG: metallophosphoesterase [Lachnospiraceae bacterium]|nr:metallophosphoesterase [Lachnospiraceae bacterium]
MDKILFIADLHGNMPATLALEKEISRIQPDDIWFLGDEYPDLPGKEAYKNELLTGVYSRS